MALHRGTADWFKLEKLHLIERLKAVDSFSAAANSFKKLVELGGTGDTDLREALHTAGVIHYARPFSRNRVGDATYSFKTSVIKSHPDYDEGIHQQLIDLRNKLVAHSDRDYADGRLHQKKLTTTSDSEQVTVIVGASLMTHTVHMLHEMGLAERYLSHATAAQEALHNWYRL